MGKSHTANTKQRNNPCNCLSIVARVSHSQGHCHRKRENATKRKKMLYYEFEYLGAPPSKASLFCTIRHVFPRVVQKLYPDERPNAVPGLIHTLHRSTTPWEDRLGDKPLRSYSTMIRVNMNFKTMDKVNVKSACLIKLCKMGILLRTCYTNPLI